jgi:hypothetical protein
MLGSDATPVWQVYLPRAWFGRSSPRPARLPRIRLRQADDPRIPRPLHGREGIGCLWATPSKNFYVPLGGRLRCRDKCGHDAGSARAAGDGGRRSCANDTQPSRVGYAVLSLANVPCTASGVRWRDGSARRSCSRRSDCCRPLIDQHGVPEVALMRSPELCLRDRRQVRHILYQVHLGPLCVAWPG